MSRAFNTIARRCIVDRFLPSMKLAACKCFLCEIEVASVWGPGAFELHVYMTGVKGGDKDGSAGGLVLTRQKPFLFHFFFHSI